MAAQFAHENKNVLAGLILMGTSHPRDIDLSSFTLSVVKLYATNDGLASLPEVFENKGKLPSHAQWVEIKGGNHAQFGYYGSQLGDDNATITREVQQSLVNQTVIGFLKAIENQ